MNIKNYEDFKTAVYKMTGINLSLYKERQMKRRINSLISRNSIKDYNDYYYALRSDNKLYEQFINYLTINVSQFYRNIEQWNVLTSQVIPMLLDKKAALKIWSSACSTGEEPYTMVMALSKFFPLSSIKIIATDIDEEAINKAKIGIYNSKSVQNVPSKHLIEFFNKEGQNTYKIKDEVKKCVNFSKINLLEDYYPSNCDLILCRNVLIYFTDGAKEKIYTKFNKALNPNGVLFVGSTEQIMFSANYGFKSIKTFFYQKENK